MYEGKVGWVFGKSIFSWSSKKKRNKEKNII